MLLEYARKLGVSFPRKLENCIRKLGAEVMETTGMMICEGSILHKAEAPNFTHSLLSSENGFSKGCNGNKLKLLCQRLYCSEKVVNWIPHEDKLKSLSHSIYCPKGVADLIPY